MRGVECLASLPGRIILLKNLQYALDWRLGGLDILEMRKVSFSCRETNLDSSEVQPVAVILTGYHGFLKHRNKSKSIFLRNILKINAVGQLLNLQVF
jgi:hypothetical protein